MTFCSNDSTKAAQGRKECNVIDPVGTLNETPQQKWRRLHPESDTEYYLKNRERIIQRIRTKYFQNPQPKKDYAKKYYNKNRQIAIARYYANREDNLSKSRIWKQKNKERHAAHSRKYHKLHPDQHVAACQKRRALKKAATINLKHIREWMAEIRSRTFANCYYCGTKLESKSVHFDHIVALSKGGAHSVENLCVSCPECNLSKRAKSIRAWVKIGQQILEL